MSESQLETILNIAKGILDANGNPDIANHKEIILKPHLKKLVTEFASDKSPQNVEHYVNEILNRLN